MTTRGRLSRDAVLVAGAGVVGTGAGALIVVALDASATSREWLVFGFAAPGRRPEHALEIATSNLRLAGAGLLGAWTVQLRPSLRPLLDAVLGLVASLNLAMMGAALAGYGERLLASVALHGVLELAGFALVGAAYLSARTSELTARRLAAAGGIALMLLSASAVIEAYAQLRGPRWLCVCRSGSAA